MRQAILIITFLTLTINLLAQEIKIRDNIDKDSLFNILVNQLPEETKSEFQKTYTESDIEVKEYLLFMISLPQSSKKDLIQNYELMRQNITNLKKEYSKLVPENYLIYIEFEPESKIFTIPEQLTFKIYKVIDTNIEVVSENWNLKPKSKELDELIKTIGWTEETLLKIKELLEKAKCISIENGTITTIGFARSGMGKYSYKIFENDLTQNQIKEYNNGCEYIFYKDNVVLEYGGGAVGQQCFEED